MEEDVKKKFEEEAIACVDKALQTGYERGYNDGKKFNEEDFDYKSGREKGREEAWEAAKKIVFTSDIGGLSYEALTSCFGNAVFPKIFNTYSPSEAIDRIKKYETEQETERCCHCIHGCETGRLKHNAYCNECTAGSNYEEEQNEIKVGDEVHGHNNVAKGLVIGIVTVGDERKARILWVSGITNLWGLDSARKEKTGRTFPQIAEALEQLKGGQDGITSEK